MKSELPYRQIGILFGLIQCRRRCLEHNSTKCHCTFRLHVDSNVSESKKAEHIWIDYLIRHTFIFIPNEKMFSTAQLQP